MQEALSHIADICFKNGIKNVIISPGSRNAPLIDAFVKHPKINCFSIIDERSAGYVAIGMARVFKEPVAVICTSGSAVANFYSAVTEAFYLPTSVLFITADRPEELQNAWDGQTIKQANIFEKNLEVQENISPEDLIEGIQAYQKTFNVCKHLNIGPSHLNIQLREPLYAKNSIEFEEYVGDFFEEKTSQKTNDNLVELKEAIQKFDKIIWVNGAAILTKNEQEILEKIHQKNQFFIISDIASSVHHLQSQKAWEWSLTWYFEEIKNELSDYLLISTGTSHLSKNLKKLFRTNKPAMHFHILENGNIADQFFTNPIEIQENLETVCEGILSLNLDKNIAENPLNIYGNKTNENLKSIQKNTNEFWEEMDYCQYIFEQLKVDDVLHVSNSMPIRYASLLLHSKKGIKTYTNRGVSGIDGCVSAAVGAAKIDNKKRHILLTGDIALAYDNNVFWNNFATYNLVIIVLNNYGGGIFNIIEGPETIAETNKFIRTNHHQNFSNLAAYYSLDYIEVDEPKKLIEFWQEITPIPNKPTIIEIKTNAETNAAYFNNIKKHTEK